MPDEVFHALSNPVRRRLLEVLADGPRTAGDLAGLFALSRPAVAEHLRVLRLAGLVRDEQSGRHRHYHLTASPPAAVEAWLRPFERFWRARLRSLKDLVEESPVSVPGTITLDQYIEGPPAAVWRALTDPALHAEWWASGDVSGTLGHTFHLTVPGWGEVPCEVVESEKDRRLVYTFTGDWTIAWDLVAVGTGTRLTLTHSGFDLDDHRGRDAFTRMAEGWRSAVLPRLAEVVGRLS